MFTDNPKTKEKHLPVLWILSYSSVRTLLLLLFFLSFFFFSFLFSFGLSGKKMLKILSNVKLRTSIKSDLDFHIHSLLQIRPFIIVILLNDYFFAYFNPDITSFLTEREFSKDCMSYPQLFSTPVLVTITPTFNFW